MPESSPSPQPAESKSTSFSVTTLVIGTMVALAIAASSWFLLKPPVSQTSQTAKATVPITPAELDYAKNIQVGNLALSRAENFLHQQVTTLAGDVVNAGPRPVAALMVTIEFHDSMNQIVLRETRSLLGMRQTPLAPGERRSFEIAFDNIPPSWNVQQPTLQLARLQLAGTK